MFWPRAIALACLALGAAANVWAVTELQGGIAELPSHWWSSAAALVLLLGMTATLVAWRQSRPASRGTR